MVGHLIDVDGAGAIHRRREIVLHVPGQIAGVEESPVAEAQEHHDAVGVVGEVDRLALGVGGKFIGLRVCGRVDEVLATAEASKGELRGAVVLLERNFVAGVDHQALIALGGEIFRRRFITRDVLIGVVVDRVDGHPAGKGWRAAHVVDVIVGDDEVVDFFDAGGARRVDDAAGVALAGVAGVDQHRFVRGSDDQGRCAAFGVDEVDA